MSMQRPQSTFHPSTPSNVYVKKRPLSLSTRQPLSPISNSTQNETVRSFQDRHRTQFAHLHQHSDDSLREKRLEAERAELEHARLVGKEKRESVSLKNQMFDGKGKKGGRRPLSLVVRHANVQEEGRRSSMPVALAPAIVHIRANSDGGRFKSKVSASNPRNSNLNVVVETPNLDTDDVSPDTSISQSSYSWASQFSGETDELRTAAHYIKPEIEGEQDLEELADEEEDDTQVTPKDGTTRRRKKIVALAHTVRQLEGVGSREAEDPAFYDTLVKAWNERPMVGQSPYAPSADGTSPLPFTPNLPNTRHSEGSSQNHSLGWDDSVRYSEAGTRRSNSQRYSYASTLHDLAMEGGIEHANRIFLAKPWLRGSIVGSGSGNTQEFLSGDQFPKGDNRHLSLGSSPPPFASGVGTGLASPIIITSPTGEDQEHRLRKTKRFLGPIDFTASPEPSPSLEDGESAPVQPEQEQHVDEATGWGLGFMGGWFAPGPDGQALDGSVQTTIPRSTTVAQFDDAPNDDSLVDAEGESDPEYQSDDEVEQVFHEAEEGGLTNTIRDPIPPSTLEPEAEPEVELTRPESSALPSQLLVSMESPPPTTPSPLEQDLTKELDSALNLDQDISLSTSTETESDSPSLNHYPLPTYSTPSITSYPLTLQASEPEELNVRYNGGQTAVITNRNREEIQSARGSCHSSDSCSSPSTKTKSRRGSRPSLTPIVTVLTEEGLGSVVEEDHQVEPELVKNLRDERFSSAFLLAQSLAVPTPSIRSPQRTSSINVLSMISPSTTMEENINMNHSNHYFSPELSDAETMMGGPSPPTRQRALSIITSPTSMSNGRLTVPRRGSTSGVNSQHRPSMNERQLTLGSISELGLGSALIPSGTAQSISEESERLAEFDESEIDFESRSDLGGPISPGFQSRSSLGSPNLDSRRSRLGQSSLDSLPSYLRPPSISSGSFTSSSRDRPTSRYQAYQQQQLELSRRANARVAAKMSGATPAELKRMTIAQRSPQIDFEKQGLVIPEPSTTAAVLFFLGFLGPWFWIFGGWIPLGHSSSIKSENEQAEDGASVMLDFTGRDEVMKGWKWTYHPDPWVKRNRRAAAIVIPLLVLGGVGAAIAVALVLG